jgi:hypothetical protein
MRSRRLPALFTHVSPIHSDGRCGVELSFRPTGVRAPTDRIDDLAVLGPEPSVDAVQGLGKVLRLLRAARLARPARPRCLLGRAQQTSALLERALGTAVILHVRPRSCVSFTLWTEAGLERVDDVAEVVESEDAYLVVRQGGRAPLRMARDSVSRTHMQCSTWYEILGIDPGG